MRFCEYEMSVITSTASSTIPSLSTPSETVNTKSAKMYNLNVNVNAGNAIFNNLLAVESATTTPRTPEILNSLIAMTNPLDDYNFNPGDKCAGGTIKAGSSNDSNSNSSGSPLGSPASSSTPSIQKTCSQLIKAGLKLSIESKRKLSGSDSTDGSLCNKRLKKEEASDDEYDDTCSNGKIDGLTPEDEERRRRRRERNKIAATKCRLKKRERTVNLVTESEVLETQNIELKSQIKELEVQRRHLVDMLSLHSPTCMKNNANSSPPTNTYSAIQPPYDSPTSYPNSSTPYEPNSPYLRPESANILASSYECDMENPSSNYNHTVETIDIGTPYSSVATPASDANYLTQDDKGFITNESYLKNTNMLIGDNTQNDYVDHLSQYDNQETNAYQYINHSIGVAVQQCHDVNGVRTHQNKFQNTGMDNGCIA